MSETLSLPEDITALSVEDLASFVTAARQRLAELNASETVELAAATAEADEMSDLADGINRVKAEQKRRVQATADNAAKRANARKLLTELDEPEAEEPAAEEPAEELEPVAASARPTGGATTQPVPRGSSGFKNPSLADMQARAPKTTVARPEPLLTASADIPGYASGMKISDMGQLADLMQARAKSVPVSEKGDSTQRYPVASITREYRHTINQFEIGEQELREVLTAAANPDILIAAGGWCSPSEISYDLFNIVCEDGLIDLPTVGINRGGIRWPISPSFADVTSSTALWTWTETQDIAAATGTGQSGTKTCGRVPCVTFDERRLRCDGVCLTVGNLTEDAYPEMIQNWIRLLNVAQARKINRARINELRNFSSSFTVTNGSAGSGAVAPILGALELQAIDYRERYSMCEGALLEVVAPRWIRAVMRSDLRKRMGGGTDMLSATDAYLMQLFDAINIRVQWVSDYQIRTTGFPGVPGTLPTAWPTTVEFLMMAPGTVVLGQGMRLDLGIIRDSVLNQTNDHTGEWMEECWLMFNPGHEVRRLTVNICPDGTTGAADLTACDV